MARQKVAHAIMNGAEDAHGRGVPPPSVAAPAEPTHQALRNPDVRSAYESSLEAAREAFLSGHDPTNGATYLNMRVTSNRSSLKFKNGTPQGVPISTQSGPYYNSFPNKKVPSHTAWVNTYYPDEDKKGKR